jgi:hypothetical protein
MTIRERRVETVRETEGRVGREGGLKIAANRWGPQVKKRNRKGKIVGSKGVYENWVAVGRKIRPQIQMIII